MRPSVAGLLHCGRRAGTARHRCAGASAGSLPAARWGGRRQPGMAGAGTETRQRGLVPDDFVRQRGRTEVVFMHDDGVRKPEPPVYRRVLPVVVQLVHGVPPLCTGTLHRPRIRSSSPRPVVLGHPNRGPAELALDRAGTGDLRRRLPQVTVCFHPHVLRMCTGRRKKQLTGSRLWDRDRHPGRQEPPRNRSLPAHDVIVTDPFWRRRAPPRR